MSEAHIIQMPKGFLVLRIFQLVFALFTVALMAFLIAQTIGFTFSSTAYGIFCGVITLLYVIYTIVSERAVKAAYNMYAIIALDALMVVFWLSAMGSLAALRASFNIPVDIISKRYITTYAGGTWLAILAVSAAIAAIEMVLFIVSLVLYGIRVHHHRTEAANASGATVQKNEQPQQEYQNPTQTYQQPSQPQYQQQYTQGPQNGFAPVSPVQQPYQPAKSPPPTQQYPTPTQSPAPQPQYAQPAPQYPVMAPPQGYAEAPGGK
ncbi:hypothetical protein EJ08DRAFT_680972 [Tothia fuscella]|uniref:MARVEL domain-containing protein n=1 Tax=Tothia fuscella TaxID=1048955 RepID=A0A9P4NLN1_9PEZI|nr:hypothetical protein EJ08DRAFT_680972 [Tothia fuscella]